MIYVVMRSYYSDWEIYGYFTTYEEAAKYVAKSDNNELHIEVIKCLDGKEDLSDIKVRYETRILFSCQKDGRWKYFDDFLYEQTDVYDEPYSRSNKILVAGRNRSIWISINTDKFDPDVIVKTAQDLFYQYMNECDGQPSETTAEAFNKIFSAAADARKECEVNNEKD